LAASQMNPASFLRSPDPSSFFCGDSINRVPSRFGDAAPVDRTVAFDARTREEPENDEEDEDEDEDRKEHDEEDGDSDGYSE